ncbi:amino acid permease [Sciscionella sediminilitoris]|uniref:amino acid permease n=1 Tax=Sciscionella sediminilitoris TaxID=1445613 RepID=UPI00055C040E|nr:amino acid permease [Sciscionella sp. SE31]
MHTEPRSDPSGGLRRGLKRRHVNLIALGGVIGAGLFAGSGVVIHDTGPAAIIAFLIAGALMVLVMRMLAEMATARPAVGAFYVHAREALGDRAGFAVGWMYWYFYVVVVGLEAVAGGRIVQVWLPQLPLWLICLVLMGLLTATNLVSARSYGEFEYWFSSIKVLAILAFLALGVLYLCGAWPDARPGFGNLVAHGGFAPNGILPIVAAIVPCVAFYSGMEIVTIAAAESADPVRAVSRAMSTILVRVLTFFVGSILVVITVLPWDSAGTLASPYAAVLGALHIPGGETIMNAIILVAVLSCLNSSLYTGSRMLFALTRNGDAPRGLTRLGRGGVPRRAILAGTVLGFVAVIFAYFSPDLVFPFIVNSYGAIAMFVYLMVAVTQLRMRRALEREGAGIPLRMWGYPWLSRCTILALGAVILGMAVLPGTRAEFLLSLLTVAVILGAYQVKLWRAGRRNGRAADGGPGLAAPVPGERGSS